MILDHYYRLKGGLAFITHVTPKGVVVGYIQCGSEVFGPTTWNQNGTSGLRNSAYDAESWGPSNCITNKPNKEELIAKAQHISALTKRRRDESGS